MHRRHLLAGAAALPGDAPRSVAARTWPEQPGIIANPFSLGGSTDGLGRGIATLNREVNRAFGAEDARAGMVRRIAREGATYRRINADARTSMERARP